MRDLTGLVANELLLHDEKVGTADRLHRRVRQGQRDRQRHAAAAGAHEVGDAGERVKRGADRADVRAHAIRPRRERRFDLRERALSRLSACGSATSARSTPICRSAPCVAAEMRVRPSAVRRRSTGRLTIRASPPMRRGLPRGRGGLCGAARDARRTLLGKRRRMRSRTGDVRRRNADDVAAVDRHQLVARIAKRLGARVHLIAIGLVWISRRTVAGRRLLDGWTRQRKQRLGQYDRLRQRRRDSTGCSERRIVRREPLDDIHDANERGELRRLSASGNREYRREEAVVNAACERRPVRLADRVTRGHAEARTDARIEIVGAVEIPSAEVVEKREKRGAGRLRRGVAQEIRAGDERIGDAPHRRPRRIRTARGDERADRGDSPPTSIAASCVAGSGGRRMMKRKRSNTVASVPKTGIDDGRGGSRPGSCSILAFNTFFASDSGQASSKSRSRQRSAPTAKNAPDGHISPTSTVRGCESPRIKDLRSEVGTTFRCMTA